MKIIDAIRSYYWDATAAIRSRDLRRIARFALRSLGIELAHPIDEITKRAAWIMLMEGIDLVIDIGANIGQYGVSLRKSGYSGRICSFEPLPEAHSALQLIASRDPGWLVHQRCALGAKPGEALIHVSGNSYSSSLLPMTATHVQAAPDSAYVGSVLTPVHTIDELAGMVLPDAKRIFLKIDTQGYELEVLRGGRSTLKQVRVVQLELSLCSLYEGQPLYREVLDFLEDEGFEPWVFLPGFEDKSSHRMLQIEAILRRRDASFEATHQ